MLRALPKLLDSSIARLRAEAPWREKDFDSLLGFPAAEQQPDIMALVARGESAELEFKATYRWDVNLKQINKELEKVIAKTVAAYLNSEMGGTLLIGVEDDGTIRGIQDDYRGLPVEQHNRDRYEQRLRQVLNTALGKEFGPYVKVTFYEIEGRDVCRVTVAPSPAPVFATEGNKDMFYVRSGNTSQPLSLREAVSYIRSRWS